MTTLNARMIQPDGELGDNYCVDTETGAQYDPETGEILGMIDSPVAYHPDELADFIGERLMKANAKLAGLKAARQQWLDRISEMFDGEIKQTERTVEWLKTNPTWLEILRGWAAEKLVGAKTKTYKHGLLKLSFRSSRESIEVTDEAAAIDFLRDVCPLAVVDKPSILKSAIAPELKPTLHAYNCGLVFHPKGESEAFEIE